MMMQLGLSQEQIADMSPDPQSLAAGKKLALSKDWRDTGCSEEALWGLFQGSALYRVCIELAAYGYKCTCPSRKFPCKHVLGLFLRALQKGDSFPQNPLPDWVGEWLRKKSAAAARKAADPEKKKEPADEAARKKRAEKREKQVIEGLNQLDLWLNDLIRNGLAQPELSSPRFWEQQAARLVDYQAPGLASRLRKIAAIVGSRQDWYEKVLYRLGGIALLTHAFRHLSEFPKDLQADIRQIIGWSYTQEEISRSGEKIQDRWIVLGQITDASDQIRLQRTWLWAEEHNRPAMILQFAHGKQPFAEMFLPGTVYQGEMAYWHSSYPLRAGFVRKDNTIPFIGIFPGDDSVSDFLNRQAKALASNPWIEHLPCALRQVRLVMETDSKFCIRDVHGNALPLAPKEYAELLAVTGGRVFDISGEWDGYELVPMMVKNEEIFIVN